MLRLFGDWVLDRLGWTVEGLEDYPDKFVLIAAPHTSNWDGFYMLFAGFALGLKPNWLAKKSLLRPPYGWLLGRLGAIPVDRSSRQNLVAQLAQRLAEADRMFVVIPPEGTRRRVEQWKSGFYALAREAGIPIVMGYVDYGRRRVGLGPMIQPGPDTVAEDMDAIRRFYAGITPRHPEQFGTVRLGEEDGSSSESGARAGG